MKPLFRSLRRDIIVQVAAAVIASLMGMTSGEWIAWVSVAVPILRDVGVSDNEISWVVALVDIGIIISPIPSSFLMDYFGRKIILQLACLLFILTNVLIFEVNNIWFLYFARLFNGLAAGTAFVIVPIYLTEIANVQIRGALSTIFMVFFNLGLLYGFLLGWLLSYTWVIIFFAIIPILFIITSFFVPESPYYLVMKKNEKQAIKSLSKFKQLNTDSEVFLEEYDILKSTVSRDMTNKNKFWDVVGTKSNRRACLIISLLAIFQIATGVTSMVSYLSVIFPKTGGGASIYVYMIIFTFIKLLTTQLAMLLIDNWGRKKLLICYSLGTAIVQAVAGTFYLLRSSGYDIECWNWVPYAFFIILGITFSVGLSFIPSTLVGELFPMNVKSYASAIFNIFRAATSFFILKVFLFYPLQYMYFFFSFSCFVSTAFCAFYVIETKGKTFTQIQEELRKISGEET